MRILLLTQWFDPEPNNIKSLIFAKELQKRGHSVQVLTGFPNYPLGKIYDGFKLKLFKREIMDGIHVNRVWLYPSHDTNPFKRILNYTTFSLSAALLGPWLVKKVDLIYVYHPPATVALPAFILKLCKRAPILLDVNDLWPDTLWATGMMNRKWIIKIINAWCNFSYRIANKINVLSQGMKELLVTRGVKRDKISVIPCWSNEKQINKEALNQKVYDDCCLKDCFVGIYAGAMGNAQHLETLIESAFLLKNKVKNYKLLFVGHGTNLDMLKEKAEEMNLDNIFFIPIVPPDKLSGIINLADVLFIHLKNDPLFEITVPSKIQLYMASGNVIVAGIKGDAADLIRESDGGIVCDPENATDIAAAIEKLAKMSKEERMIIAKNGLDYYKKNLSFESGVTRFESVFQELQLNR